MENEFQGIIIIFRLFPLKDNSFNNFENYISVGKVVYNEDTQAYTPYTVYTDYLVSIEILTNEAGQVQFEQSFDAWGNLRDPEDWNNTTTFTSIDDVAPWLWRGYTGHEMLYDFDLVHMNGRFYDPTVARMLSPDNFVQDATATQNYNRYSYVMNNPLKYTDPDGEEIVLAAIIIGAAIGGYIGGSAANGGDLDARNWDWQSGNTWGGIGAGLIIGGAAGLGAGALGSAMAPGFASVFPVGGKAAAWTIAGGVGGAVGGYGSGLSGGLLHSRGDWEYAHSMGLYGAQVGGTAGAAIGGTAALLSGMDLPKSPKQQQSLYASMNDGKVEPSLYNESNNTIWFKPEYSSSSFSDWGAYPLGPGQNTSVRVDALNIQNKVYKVRDGYYYLKVSNRNKVLFDYPFYTPAIDRVFQIDKTWLSNYQQKNPYVEWPLKSGKYIRNRQWYNIFNPSNQIIDPRR